jgi:hypothetical protein
MASDGMQGWDVIAATRQRTINTGLGKLYTSESFKGSFPIDIRPGVQVQAAVDVTFGPPRIAALEGNGRLTEVVLPIISGTLGVIGQSERIDLKGASLSVTTALASVEAKLQPPQQRPGARNYDLILDLKSREAVFNVQIQGSSAAQMAFITEALKAALKKLADNKSYTLATFSLGGVDKSFPYVVPKEADFTFIRDKTNVDDSTFAVLLRTTSAAKGQADFSTTMLPSGAPAVTMLSNRVIMRDVIRRGLIDGLKPKLAGNEGNGYQQVEQRIVLADDKDGSCHIRNNSEIGLNVDESARIDYLHCYVADGDKLRLETNVKAFATFLGIEVQVGADVNYRFDLKTVDGRQIIDLTQVSFTPTKSVSMEWWKWLLGALSAFYTGGLSLTVMGIIYAYVKGSAPTLESSMFKFSSSVTWPYMKQFEIQKVGLPSAVRVTGNPKLLN